MTYTEAKKLIRHWRREFSLPNGERSAIRAIAEAQDDCAEVLRALDMVIEERDAAHNEIDAIRRQLAACQAELYGMRAQLGDVRVLRMQLESDNVALRRQLAEAQAAMAEWREIAIARGESLGYAEADADCIRG